MTERAPRSQGWRTTDEEEIERRRQRALTEPLAIEPLEPEHSVFGTFLVASEAGGTYEVEIRSLALPDNSCGCPDHRVNGLGTCKHVEAVMDRVGGRRQARDGNRRVEVFLRRTGERPQVRVAWPEGMTPRAATWELLGRFFARDGVLRGDPVEVLPALARAVAAAPGRIRSRIRLSRHLLPWVEEERRRAARHTARERFLAEVRTGRQSLDVVKLPLYPYQREGMLHLAFTERALLADEMGLGKTVQAIAACALLARTRGIERVLVVSPASLKAEWQEQIARFTDLPARVIQGPRAQRLGQYVSGGPGAFFYLANYEQVLADGEEIVRRLAPDVVILDEAQRIKNWQSKTAQAVKRLRSPYAFVLTGTPLENRIDEVYSIVQFLDPAIFGPLFRFNRDFYRLDHRGRPAGYRNLDELRRRLAPVLLRRRKDEVEGELPPRLDKHFFVPMEEEQAARYAEYERRVARLAAEAERRPLRPEELEQLQNWLACMRMLCDTPYILDSDCRLCPKLGELEEVLGEVLADPETKVLVFSEWGRMLELVRELAQEMEVGFAWHTGSVPPAARWQEVRRFKEDPSCRLFLSTDSGGVGLNLQAASVVINLDLPWNPARLEQRIARAWRKHQTRPVRVLYLVTEHSIEHRMLPLLAGKQALADSVLDGRGELAAMPLPSGRAALVERLGQVLGKTAPVPAAAQISSTEALREELVRDLGDRLLRLETHPGSDGRETVLLVVEGTRPEAERERVAALLRQRSGESPPALEVLDRATFAAVERLAAAGLIQFTAEGRRLVDRLSAPGEAKDAERERRHERAREVCEQSERQVRMAAVLAAGGFPREALPALRQGVELALRALAQLEGVDLPEAEPVPLAWAADHLEPHGVLGREVLALAVRLRGGAEAQLSLSDEEARSWIAEGEKIAGRLAQALRRREEAA